MRPKILLTIALFCIVFGGFFLIRQFFVSSWDIANLPPKNETIAVFGDSLVAGVGATEGNDFVSLLSKRIGTRIINLGVPGDTSETGLRRLDDVLVHDPGVVIVLLGGNDALRRVPLETTKENLNAIIGRLIENGSVVVLAGVRGAVLSDPYGEMYAEIARRHGAALVPNVLEGILLRPELTEDQIHPNDAGYAIVAERIYKVIETLD
jgi:lysophospholipase L1-like esterase